MSTYTVVGLMSGSSLDGLDIACVEFTGDLQSDVWRHRTIRCVTLPYSLAWTERINNAPNMSGADLVKLDLDYGHYLGLMVRKFVDDEYLPTVNAIASHGHTIFHQPKDQMTFQIGDGETMASHVRCPVICNFRSKDVALGGEGAPLVPCGDFALFQQYDFCLNLGGISNLSVKRDGKAFDICVCNMLLNYLSQRTESQADFDEDGDLARSGNIIEHILEKLNNLAYYSETKSKSLGREWFEKFVVPLLDIKKYPVPDLLRTSVEHISRQIANAVAARVHDRTRKLSLLATGGGALNCFLMERIKYHIADLGLDLVFEETDLELINFKEAIIFAFLGLRCLLGLVNVMKSVTGAKKDSVSGSIHYGADSMHLNNQAAEEYKFNFRKVSNATSMADSSRYLPDNKQTFNIPHWMK